MINKKADLLNNVLTSVIAVIGLALILFAAWKLYSTYVNQEDKNAQHLIDSIVGKIDTLEDGQNNTFVFAGFTSSKSDGWIIQSWSTTAPRPDKCYFKNCICICPNGGGPDIILANCQEKGFCRLFDRSVYIDTFSVPSNLFELKIDKRKAPSDIIISKI